MKKDPSKHPIRRSLEAIVEGLRVHLARIEADPDLNPVMEGRLRQRRYHQASAWRTRGGRYAIRVRYYSIHPDMGLTWDQAERYLAWLDAGHHGRHTVIPADWVPETPTAPPEAP